MRRRLRGQWLPLRARRIINDYICTLMKVAVVILNWNTADYLKRFLPGILDSCRKCGDAEVLVADSGSSDGSLEMLSECFPEVGTIPLESNYGFAGGYNRALLEVEAEYAVLLNSDVEAGGDWIAPLSGWMDSHPDCAACGPKILSLSEKDRFEYAGAAGGLADRFGYTFCRGRVMKRVENDCGQWDDSPADVFWVSGACMMVRMSAWKESGGFDGRFFAHMEEIDWCWRMWLRGWEISVVTSSAVWHLGGGSLPQDSPEKLRLNFRNNLLMLENNLVGTFIAQGSTPRKAAAKARMRLGARMVLDLCSAAVYLLGGRKEAAKAVVRAHSEFRSMRKGVPASTVVRKNGREAKVPAGYFDGSMIFEALLRGKGVFEYFRRKRI